MHPFRLFLAYSHLDDRFRQDLERQLRLLARKRPFSWWGEHRIVPGQPRNTVMEQALGDSDIILLLVSIHFLADDFCWSYLLASAVERHQRKDALVIPVHVRPCAWEDTPVAQLQGVPRDGRAVSQWGDKHMAWTVVARGIQEALDAWYG